MAVSFPQSRRPLGAIALLAAVAATAGCGGGSTGATRSSSAATLGTSARSVLASFRNGFLALQYPAGWKTLQSPPGEALHFQPMVYLSAQPAHDPCRQVGTTTTCGWPVRTLRPDSVLVMWENRGAPGWSLAGAQGTKIRVDGRPAVRSVTSPGACGAIGADETVSVEIQRPLRYNWTAFTACLRGPDLSTQRREVSAILASTRFLTP
jgi:hypothetical protein